MRGAGLPVVDIMDVRVRTRCGHSAAKVCAIMPPIDTPTTWARSTPARVEQARVSSTMSVSVYGAVTGLRSSARAIERGMSGRPAAVSRDEPPQSRLSKVMMRKPCASSVARKASGHMAAGMPSPWISSTGGAAGSPLTS